MSQKLKSKSQNLDELKQIITRDIMIGGKHDKLSDATINLYVRQILKLYKASKKDYQWSPNEFIVNIQYPTKFDDANFKRHTRCKTPTQSHC